MCPHEKEPALGVHYDPSRRKYVVRWRDGDRRRTRRFDAEAEAVAFARALATPDRDRPPSAGIELAPQSVDDAAAALDRARAGRRDAIYAYPTAEGTRWRFLFRQSNGMLSSRRGFTSRTAAATARRRLLEEIRRGEVRVSRESFETFWHRVLRDKKPFITAGSYEDFATHGRKRLLPFFGQDPLSVIDEERVRDWLETMVDLVDAGDLSPKTVNNARTYLSVVLQEAVQRGLIARNPCARVHQLPVELGEIDYLRLSEIDAYLDACADHYRALAAFLIGSGARVSEGVHVRWDDLDLERGAVRIYRQRARTGSGTARTKGKRFRGVQIGPRLCTTLERLARERRAAGVEDQGWVFLCPRPKRGRYARRTTIEPPHRKTVHDWHEATLVDARLRDMPLHCLRHTAAAAWLSTGHPLIFVQRQLGHRSITTTESHYGHLETSFLEGAAAKTERVIKSASAHAPKQLFA
jgi:integrase